MTELSAACSVVDEVSAVIDSAKAEIVSLRAQVGLLRRALRQSAARLNALSAGMTHWDGCEQHHSVCAARKIIIEALATTEAQS